MNPHQRLSYTLIATLILWAPVALSALSGGIEVWQSGLYFLVIVLFSYMGTGLIQRLTDNYRQTQNALERAKKEIEIIERRQAAAENDLPNRRSTD